MGVSGFPSAIYLIFYVDDKLGIWESETTH